MHIHFSEIVFSAYYIIKKLKYLANRKPEFVIQLVRQTIYNLHSTESSEHNYFNVGMLKII